MAFLKMRITNTVLSGQSAVTELSKKLEARKGRKGAALGFALFFRVAMPFATVVIPLGVEPVKAFLPLVWN